MNYILTKIDYNLEISKKYFNQNNIYYPYNYDVNCEFIVHCSFDKYNLRVKKNYNFQTFNDNLRQYFVNFGLVGPELPAYFIWDLGNYDINLYDYEIISDTLLDKNHVYLWNLDVKSWKKEYVLRKFGGFTKRTKLTKLEEYNLSGMDKFLNDFTKDLLKFEL